MESVKLEEFGKDHYSTLAYIETLAVDYHGLAVPDNRRMRTNEITHTNLVGGGEGSGNWGASKYPTRLKTRELEGHDDWDCLDDFVKLGILEEVGTGLRPAFKLTKLGMKFCALLRQHKMNGGVFHNFDGVSALESVKVILHGGR